MGWEERIREFVCHRCGNCCRGDGYVWLTQTDIRRLAEHLGLTREEFLKSHTRLAEGKIALLDQPGPDKWCIFYEPGLGCRVNPVKPWQCIGFPIRWRDEDSIDFCRGLQALAEGDEVGTSAGQ